ncbi:MAG: TolC family protein [Armatimonadetes bacterium]|nr:TolC family protein [Armatimonadota bacterium]
MEDPPGTLSAELSPAPLPDELLPRAYAERPEMLAAEAQIARYDAKQHQAAAGLQPEVRAIASYYLEGTSLSLNYANWYLGVRASLPLRDSVAPESPTHPGRRAQGLTIPRHWFIVELR